MFEDILTNPVYNVISFILTIAGFVLAFFFYYKSKSIKSPCYDKKSRYLISNELQQSESIQIMFNGAAIENLSTTCIAFWNNGRTTITKDDIAQKDTLKIEVSDRSEILSINILACSRKANNFCIELHESKKYAIISFDFIDFKQGAVIQIYHTGLDDKDIDITGTIKGVGSFVNAHRSADIVFSIMRTLDRLISKRILDNIVSARMIGFMERVKASQNIFLIVISTLPFMIILFPFYIIYTTMMVIVFLTGLLIFPFELWKYSIPRDLYSAYDHGIYYDR